MERQKVGAGCSCDARGVCKVPTGVRPRAGFCSAGHKRHRSERKCREAAALLGSATQVPAAPARSGLSKARLMSLLAHISPRRVPLWPHSAHLPKMLYPIREIYFFLSAVQECGFPIHKKKNWVLRFAWGWSFVGAEEEEHVPM